MFMKQIFGSSLDQRITQVLSCINCKLIKKKYQAHFILVGRHKKKYVFACFSFEHKPIKPQQSTKLAGVATKTEYESQINTARNINLIIIYTELANTYTNTLRMERKETMLNRVCSSLLELGLKQREWKRTVVQPSTIEKKTHFIVSFELCEIIPKDRHNKSKIECLKSTKSLFQEIECVSMMCIGRDERKIV